jgi:hypothetical protein
VLTFAPCRLLLPATLPLSFIVMNQASPSWHYRLAVASRALAAIAGSYVLSAVSTTLLATLLPQSKAEAVITATLLSFIVFCCAVLWVFAARNAWRAWVGLLVPSAVCGLGLWLQRGLA